MKNVKYLAILLATAMLGGCAGDVQDESKEAIQTSIVENLDEEVSEESGEQDLLEEHDESEELDEELIEDEPVTVEYVEWDGTGTIKKKKGEANLSDMQYFGGRTYVVDKDNRNLGAEFPVVPRKVGEQLIEPVISKFLLTESELLYLEETPNTTTYDWSNRCYDLYVQHLDTGDVRLLAAEVDEAVYQEGVITYEKFVDCDADYKEIASSIRQVDVKTGEILNELDFGTNDFVWYYNKDNVYYDREDKSYCYNFATKTTEEIVFPGSTRYTRHYYDGNIYATIYPKDNVFMIVQLYEQGDSVYRIFPKEFSYSSYFSHDKVFYEADRKIMEYNLETGEERYLCDLGENQYGPCDFCGAQENNGMVLLEESGPGAPGEYGTHYLYEVKDGVKTLVTSAFWTS